MSIQLREMLLKLVFEENLAFSIVLSSNLKMLLESFSCKEIKMPTTSTLIGTLTKTFDKNDLGKQKYVCTTCDVWTHRAKNFLGVSVHYIDENWDRKSYVLAFRYLSKRHTYDYLAHVLSDIYKEFLLSHEKIIHTITDGGSNFCKAFRIFGQDSDFSKSLEAMVVEDEFDDCDDDDDQDDLVIVANETENSNENPQVMNEIQNDVEDELIQGDQIDFPEDINFIYDGIILPKHMRCFSHLLNLLGTKTNYPMINKLCNTFLCFIEFSGKVDFFHELESYKQTFEFFMSAYNKLKRLWNLTSRSSFVHNIVVQICGSALKTPGVTRWNSEYDSMYDAYEKRDKVSSIIVNFLIF